MAAIRNPWISIDFPRYQWISLCCSCLTKMGTSKNNQTDQIAIWSKRRWSGRTNKMQNGEYNAKLMKYSPQATKLLFWAPRAGLVVKSLCLMILALFPNRGFLSKGSSIGQKSSTECPQARSRQLSEIFPGHQPGPRAARIVMYSTSRHHPHFVW